MASMNNWLGFSLSPQEIPSSQVPLDHHHSHNISGGDCFDLTSADSTMLPSLNLPPGPFGLLEAFNRNNQSSQDWDLKEVSTNYKNSLIIGRSTCNNPTLENQETPKLENFLGGHSFSTTEQNHKPSGENYMYPNNPSQTNSTNGGGGGGGGMANNSTIGLSMIKNWLRNNPSAQSSSSISHHQENRNDQELHDAAVLGANKYINATSTNATVNCTSSTTASPHHQNLSLSMSTGSQSASALPLLPAGGGSSDGDNGGEMSSSSDNKQPKSSSSGMAVGGGLDAQSGAIEAVPRKSLDTFGQRTSIYRGVTRHRWTGRYEAHLWDNSCRREGQTRKGRQVYLGGYDKEEKAARAYDLAALKYWGSTTTTNFPISNYEKEIEEMKHMTRQEYVASLRRKSSGFSRGASIYRGVTRHHQHGRWQARIGRVAGNKDLYLGTFSTQEEAAEAYDIAAIKFRGLNAVTNFEISRYDVKSILESSTLPIGGAAKRLKDAEQAEMAVDAQRASDEHISSHLTDGMSGFGAHHAWPTIAFHQPQPLSMHYPYGQQQRLWCKQENDSEVTHSFQDFRQMQLGNTHNFLQPSVLHNLMSLDSTSVEHSTGSNSVIYSNGGGHSSENAAYQGVGYGSSSSGYLLPMSTVIADQEGNNQGNGFGGNVYGSSDPYQTRNFYYHPHQSSSSNGILKAGIYDQGSSCNTWVPTAVPTLAARSNNMAVCHGSSTFTVWNDA